MSALNFQKQFAPDVESGKKKQTIRALRKDGRPSAKVGGPLTLYTGMRTKVCRKLKDTTCKNIRGIKIKRGSVTIEGLGDVINIDKFARDDGFKSMHDFYNFFETNHGFPFEGALIEWR